MANLTVILYLCAAVPMIPALNLMTDKKSRLFLAYMLLGMTICLIASGVNTQLLKLFGGDMLYVSTNVTPIAEELLKALPVCSVPVLSSGSFNSMDEVLGFLGDSCYISENHIEHLREDATRLGLDADRVCRETDVARTMEGIYIKVEENGEVVDRMKYVRASFLQTVEESQSHWLDRPIVPNRITSTIHDLFI